MYFMKTRNCKSCGAEIVWLKTNNNKNIPVDRNSIIDEDATIFDPNQMISHFATCPDSEKWREKKK